MTISAVELVPCSVVEAPALLGPSVARAHTAGSPTVLGEPHVVDLVGLEGMHELLGTLFPPPGDYCGLEVMIGPADADAEGLPAAIDLVGTSVHLAGTLTPSGGAPRAFLLESASELHVELTFAAPLSLSLEASPAGALAATDHLTWLDGIDFDVDSTATQEAALLANLSASLVAVPIPATPAP